MWNVDEVKTSAMAVVMSDPEEARRIFLQSIMDWTDNFTENFDSEAEKEDSIVAMKCISKLWIEYAKMEIVLRQYKKAVQVFDNALEDEIASRCTEVYIAYANFCKERSKHGNAAKVYLRGLKSECHGHVNTDMIWKEYLDMARHIPGNDDLTIERLYATVLAELSDSTIAAPSENFNLVVPSSSDVAEAKEPEIVDTHPQCTHIKVEKVGSISAPKSDSPDLGNSSSHNTSMKPMELLPTQVLPLVGDELDDLSGLTPEQLCRTYLLRPPMLFISPVKEPMLSGLRCLSEDIQQKLEDFLEEKLPSRTPGVRLNSKAEGKLDVIELLWTVQALKEKHFDWWWTDLTRHQKEEEEKLLRVCRSREAGLTGTALDDVRQTMKTEDLKRFKLRCEVQKEVLSAAVNKTMVMLLLEQERVMCDLGVPFFTLDVIEKIESSRTNVRKYSPGDTHSFDSSLVETIHLQQRVVCALLSLRFVCIPPPAVIMHPSGGMGGAKRSLHGDLVLGPHGDSGMPGTASDYYSSEARAKRKKRRVLGGSGHASPIENIRHPHVAMGAGGRGGRAPIFSPGAGEQIGPAWHDDHMIRTQGNRPVHAGGALMEADVDHRGDSHFRQYPGPGPHSHPQQHAFRDEFVPGDPRGHGGSMPGTVSIPPEFSGAHLSRIGGGNQFPNTGSDGPSRYPSQAGQAIPSAVTEHGSFVGHGGGSAAALSNLLKLNAILQQTKK